MASIQLGLVGSLRGAGSQTHSGWVALSFTPCPSRVRSFPPRASGVLAARLGLLRRETRGFSPGETDQETRSRCWQLGVEGSSWWTSPAHSQDLPESHDDMWVDGQDMWAKPPSLHLVRWRISGLIKEEMGPWCVRITEQAYWVGTAWKGPYRQLQETLQGQLWHPEQEQGKGTPRREWNHRRDFCVSVASLSSAVGSFQVRDPWRARADLGSFMAPGFVLSKVSWCWVQFFKVGRLRWLKIPFFGLYLKQSDVWGFEFSTGGLGACCEEVKNTEVISSPWNNSSHNKRKTRKPWQWREQEKIVNKNLCC